MMKNLYTRMMLNGIWRGYMYKVCLQSIHLEQGTQYLNINGYFSWSTDNIQYFNTFEEAFIKGMEYREGYWVGIIIEDESGKEYNIFGADAISYFDINFKMKHEIYSMLINNQKLTYEHIDMLCKKEPECIYELRHDDVEKYLYKKWLGK